MKKKKETASVSLQIDLSSSQIVGNALSKKDDPNNNEIALKIIESVKKTLNNISNWIKDFKLLVESGNHAEAFELFNKNKETLQIHSKGAMESLLLLDRSVLDREKRKTYTSYLIALASKEAKFGIVEPIIDEFYKEFETELEIDFKQNILLLKGNAAAQNNKLNAAANYYKKIIEDKDVPASTQAWALRGLSLISIEEEDIVRYSKRAIDKFIEAGNKKEAVTDLVGLSSLFDNKSPERALEYMDKAIELYDGKDNLNKEYSAGLHHRKAGYLYSLKRYEAALESIEVAFKLREGIIGNEYEKYSSIVLALRISEILKETDKVNFYSTKLTEVTPLISNIGFLLQERFSEKFKKREKLDSNLIHEIENSEFPHIKMSMYLFNTIIDEYTFEEKMEWLDKAKALLTNKEFLNVHFSFYYFASAEVYRKEKKLSEAVSNYQKSLEYNPSHWESMQHCIAILWEEKDWVKAQIFLRSQIDKLGELPNMCYVYGRVCFELGEYQEAFNYLRKADGVEAAEKYITLCLKKDKSIKLDSLTTNKKNILPPISLDSFKDTLAAFAKSISSNSRMHFWKNTNGKYSWAPSPEKEAKHFLITALEVKYGKNCIEIIEERTAGAGIIDLYVILRGGIKIVVELKICGGGYSSTYAISGEDQLLHYLKNTTDTHIGFLVVFDGRSEEFGMGFKATQSFENLTIYTIAIEMSPKIQKRKTEKK